MTLFIRTSLPLVMRLCRAVSVRNTDKMAFTPQGIPGLRRGGGGGETKLPGRMKSGGVKSSHVGKDTLKRILVKILFINYPAPLSTAEPGYHLWLLIECPFCALLYLGSVPECLRICRGWPDAVSPSMWKLPGSLFMATMTTIHKILYCIPIHLPW